MSKIIIEKDLSEERLKELGISAWEIIEFAAPSKSALIRGWRNQHHLSLSDPYEVKMEYGRTEQVYILEGEVIITPDGEPSVTIIPGDYVIYPKGLKCNHKVTEDLRQRYAYESTPHQVWTSSFIGYLFKVVSITTAIILIMMALTNV